MTAHGTNANTRVLIVHGEAIYLGGAEVLLARLVTHGLGPGIELTVARVAVSPLARALPSEVSVVDLPPNQPFSLWGLRRQLAALRGVKCDVIHAWGGRGWELAALAAKKLRRPVLGTLHDHPEAEYLTRARRRLMRWTARWGLDRVTVVSEALRVACVEAGWPEEKLSVIRNGVSLRAAPACELSSGALRFGFLGSLTAAKGLPDLLASAAQLARSTPTGWELHIAGRTQTEAEAAELRCWQAPFASQPWWPQVKWRGWVEPASFLAEVDVLVYPSRTFETFGLAPAEAALAGVPTLGARVGAVPEVVVDGQTGWLFPPGDTAAGAEAMARLVAQSSEVARFGATARKRMEQEFQESKMLAGYREVWQQTAGKNGGDGSALTP